MKLNEFGEHRIIERIKKSSSLNSKNLQIGIGDDCAAFKFSGKDTLIVSTDSLIEHIHFKRNKILPFQLGWKSIAVNLSDIAAMGGVPKFVLISLACPKDISVGFIDEFYAGINAICSKFSTSIAGGDLTSSKSDLMINITIIGAVGKKLPVKRTGAKLGDKIFVTGTLGDSAAGLFLLMHKDRYKDVADLNRIMPDLKSSIGDYEGDLDPVDKMVARHIIPSPKINEALKLVDKYRVTSMIDLSDCLTFTINEICKQSNTGARVFIEKLPVSYEMKKVQGFLEKNIKEYCLFGSEDYEILFTLDKNDVKNLPDYVTCIGEIVAESEGVKLVDRANILNNIENFGYEHFKKE